MLMEDSPCQSEDENWGNCAWLIYWLNPTVTHGIWLNRFLILFYLDLFLLQVEQDEKTQHPWCLFFYHMCSF